MSVSLPARSLDGLMGVPLGHRFGVSFLIKGQVPNPIDIRFQRVSGLDASIASTVLQEGGQNLYAHRLPDRVGYQNLVLERGHVVGSRLNFEFNDAMSTLLLVPSDVFIFLLNEAKIPLAAWLFVRAWPVRWATSPLDADQDAVVIDTLELAYQRMQVVSVR